MDYVLLSIAVLLHRFSNWSSAEIQYLFTIWIAFVAFILFHCERCFFTLRANTQIHQFEVHCRTIMREMAGRSVILWNNTLFDCFYTLDILCLLIKNTAFEMDRKEANRIPHKSMIVDDSFWNFIDHFVVIAVNWLKSSKKAQTHKQTHTVAIKTRHFQSLWFVWIRYFVFLSRISHCFILILS